MSEPTLAQKLAQAATRLTTELTTIQQNADAATARTQQKLAALSAAATVLQDPDVVTALADLDAAGFKVTVVEQ